MSLPVNHVSKIPDLEISGIPHEAEVDLVIVTMECFARGTPERERIRRIWHACSLSGALRENFPPGTEELKAAWYELVAECRRSVQ